MSSNLCFIVIHYSQCADQTIKTSVQLTSTLINTLQYNLSILAHIINANALLMDRLLTYGCLEDFSWSIYM